jgi:hypothetical protein
VFEIHIRCLTAALFSSVFAYSDKRRELFDYATTMWDITGAIYEKEFLSFPA